MLVINELGEFVDVEPPKPWERTVPDPTEGKTPRHRGVCAVCGGEITDRKRRVFCSDGCAQIGKNSPKRRRK